MIQVRFREMKSTICDMMNLKHKQTSKAPGFQVMRQTDSTIIRQKAMTSFLYYSKKIRLVLILFVRYGRENWTKKQIWAQKRVRRNKNIIYSTHGVKINWKTKLNRITEHKHTDNPTKWSKVNFIVPQGEICFEVKGCIELGNILFQYCIDVEAFYGLIIFHATYLHCSMCVLASLFSCCTLPNQGVTPHLTLYCMTQSPSH